MTREGAKKWAKEIQAFADGKEIQLWNNHFWQDVDSPVFHNDGEYRIKPESKLIPFDFSDAEKLIGKAVKSKNAEMLRSITDIGEESVYFSVNRVTFSTLLNSYTFLDGSPCGKVVE